ncbi:glucosaminidase domain-containing protein [Candidatus Saccharibacteria bacterium]|nr:glucosaminidase domain-containing protein [Candidatus Saccharibacteria bacterium]MBR0372683.1 glucosaminidase domain-containing protein [Candidatus Saccharibacteria bacterium]
MSYAKIRKILAFALIGSFLFISGTAKATISEKELDIFSQNNILFYDPSDCLDRGSNSYNSLVIGETRDERLKSVVESYGPLAMDLQREWGTPWEVVFAQMLKESGVGTSKNGIDAAVAENGYFNWLGITGDGGKYSVGIPYVSSVGRHWAQYESVENMIKDWAGEYIARNGYYDKAFKNNLDPNSFNLRGFLNDFILVYAPPSENDTSGYIADVESILNGTIKDVRKEKGWPSSEELATKENISIGGKHSLGSGHDDTSSGQDSSTTTSSVFNLTSSDEFSDCIWQSNTYSLSDGQLKGLLAIAKREQGDDNLPGVKFEASIFANLYERNTKDSTFNASGLVDYVRNGGWFGSTSEYSESYSNYTQEEFNAIKDVLVNGRRVIPQQVVEHDCIGDLEWVELNGEKHYSGNAGGCHGTGLYDKSLYVSGKTKIHNVYGATYTFYDFPTSGDMDSGDPFGYFDEPGEPDSCSSSCTPENVEDYPRYDAGDSRWSKESYGSCGTMSSCACGAFSIAMLATVATGHEILPTDIKAFTESEGLEYYYNTSTMGETTSDLTQKVGEHFGFSVEEVKYKDKEEAETKLREYLKKGYMIQVGGGRDDADVYPFSRKGHIIGIWTINDQDEVYVANSTGSVKSRGGKWVQGGNQWIKLRELVDAGLTYGSFSAIPGGTKTCDTSDYCSESSESKGAGGLVSGGMTKEQAETFIKAYYDEAMKQKSGAYGLGSANGTAVGDGLVSDAGCPYGALNNCVAMSQWFINNYTTVSQNIGTANGVNYASHLISSGGLIDGGNTPKAYAIFSKPGPSSAGHTGVVLGVDTAKGEVYTAEAFCHMNYPFMAPKIVTYSIDTMTSGTYDFAYTDNVLKMGST